MLMDSLSISILFLRSKRKNGPILVNFFFSFDEIILVNSFGEPNQKRYFCAGNS